MKELWKYAIPANGRENPKILYALLWLWVVVPLFAIYSHAYWEKIIEGGYLMLAWLSSGFILFVSFSYYRRKYPWSFIKHFYMIFPVYMSVSLMDKSKLKKGDGA
jgi:hypothetical protein